MQEGSPSFGNGLCFVVCAVKGDDSEERQNAEFLEHYVLKPILEFDPFNLRVERHDETDEPGTISSNIIDRLITDEIVVIDLSYDNINVGYEMGIRHSFQKASILVVRAGSARAGSDVTHHKYIKYDPLNVVTNEKAKGQIRKLMTSIRSGNYDDRLNPVTEAAKLRSIDSSEEQSFIRSILGRLDRIELSIANQTSTRIPKSSLDKPHWVETPTLAKGFPLIGQLSDEERDRYLRVQLPLASHIRTLNDNIRSIQDSYNNLSPKLSSFDQTTLSNSVSKSIAPLLEEYENLTMLGLPPGLVRSLRNSTSLKPPTSE